MAMIQIDYDDREVLAALRDLQARVGNLRPALLEIGEDLLASTKDRFQTSTAPDGSRWAPNTQATILDYLAGVSGAYGKKGKLVKKGVTAAMGKKPLVREGYLQDTIDYQILDDGLYIGSPQKYAATQQFGARRGEYGPRTPWGDIPARPFLGVSDDDRRSILDTLSEYLRGF